MTDSGVVSESIQESVEALLETELPAATWPSGRPRFDFNGVVTNPARPQRKLFGLFSVVEVPAGTWGIGYQEAEDPLVLNPGVHWFNNLQGELTAVQLVEATRRRHEMEPVSGLTADGWRVTLWTVLLYEVVDPVAAARAAGVRKALEAAGRAAILAQLETMTHQDVIGAVWATESEGAVGARPATQNGGLKAMEEGILARLMERPGLEALKVIEVAVVEREGDERLVEIMREAEVERKQVREERQTEIERADLAQIRLATEAQVAAAARTTALIEAQTQAQVEAVKEEIRLLQARTEADVEEIRQVQEAREAERKRRAEEWRTAKQLDLKVMEYQHEETLAIIQGTAQVTAEAAKAGLLEDVQDKLWPQPGNSEVVGQGIQALRTFREQSGPPVTHFLPPVTAGLEPGQNRVQAEAMRLSRIRGAEHELIVRRGQVAAARVWFEPPAPAALVGVTVEVVCGDTYPLDAPLLLLTTDGVAVEQPVADWHPDLFLADMVREMMVEQLRVTTDPPARVEDVKVSAAGDEPATGEAATAAETVAEGNESAVEMEEEEVKDER